MGWSFKDKNVIIVLMESIDDWLVTEDIMPTVRQLMDEGIEFENHFLLFMGEEQHLMLNL